LISVWKVHGIAAHGLRLQQHDMHAGVQSLQTQYVRYSGQLEATQCSDGWLLSASRAQAARLSTATPQRPSSSGVEGSMSTSAPHASSAPNTPCATTQSTAHAAHASLSPRPFAGSFADPTGEVEAMSTTPAASELCGGLGDDDGTATQLPQQVQLTIENAPAEFCVPIKRDKRFKPNFQVSVCCFPAGHHILSAAPDPFAVASTCGCRPNHCAIANLPLLRPRAMEISSIHA
jgi:hypothetical protein